MREIKFRCWHKNGKYILGGQFLPGMIYDQKQGDCLLWLSQGQEIIEIMQYTGLKDKNGKEIYEGDILSCQGGYEDGDDESHALVSWDNTQAMFVADDMLPLCDFDIGEVIGNRYENPELLEM